MTALLCAIFFLSGAAALLFETLWFHQTGLTFGNGVWATSLVLAGFMAGLALGNLLVARLGARIRRPVRFYALMEVAIAVSGIGLVFGLPLLTPLLAPMLRPILEQTWLVNPIRLVIGFAILLIPSTAMGVTLPLLVKALLARDPNFGSVLGRLYGWNTLGAVLGAVAGEAALVEWLGIRGSALFAGGLNLLVAGAALALSRFFESAAADPRPDHASWQAAIPAEAKRRLAATFLAGGTLLALEVVWFRFLQLFIHASSLVFSLMLAVVLSGIALGSFFAGALLRRRPEAERGVAAFALLAAAFVAFLYRAFSFVEFPDQYAVDWPLVLAYGSLLMGPVALVSGALFTLIGAGLHRLVSPAIRATGLLTFANTVGSGIGSLIGGFILLPYLGMEASFLVLALCYVGVAALTAPAPGSARTWAMATGAVAAALVSFPLGLMRDHYVTIPVQRFAGGAEIEVMKEGRSETILYTTQRMQGEPLSHRLVTNGFSMSGNHALARRYMKLYVWLPEVLHPDLESALLISYGVGSTAKALTDTDSLEHIDVVDLSSEVIELSGVVYPDSEEHPLNDPRVQVHIEDGRYFLQTTDRRYDLITGEPPPPKNAGIVNLYTREFFELVYDRLEPGGIHTYWVPIHNLSEQDTKSIVRGFCDVFADCTLWGGTGMDWMLVGSREASWPPDAQRFSRLFADPDSVDELFATGIGAPEALGAMFMRDAEDLAALTSGTPPLVDDFPKRLSDVPPDLPAEGVAYAAWTDAAANREHFRESAWVAANWPPELVQSTLPWFDLQAVWTRHTRLAEPRSIGARLRDLHEVLAHGGAPSLALMELGTDADQLELLHGLPKAKQRAPEALFRFGMEAMVAGDWQRASDLLRRAHGRMEANEKLLRIRIYALCRAGRVDEAASLSRRYFANATAGSEDRDYWEWLEEQFGLPDPLRPLAANPVGS